MNVIARPTLITYGEKYPNAKGALDAWYCEAKAADWKTPQDIKNRYCSASILKGNVVIFDIKGPQYRLVVKVSFQIKTIYIK